MMVEPHSCLDSPGVLVEHLSFAYPNAENVFDETSFNVPRGSITCIAGESGSGKTTLGYILKGLIPHAMRGTFHGRVLVDGHDTRKASIAQLARVAGMLFQNLDAQIFSPTVQAEIEFGLRNLKMDTALARDAMIRLGIEQLAQKNPLNLSAGQKQRVLIAATIAPRPSIMILDEPLSHLDQKGRVALMQWLVELNKNEGTTIIVFDQDPRMAGEICTAHFLIERKRVIQVQKEDILEQGQCWRWKDARK